MSEQAPQSNNNSTNHEQSTKTSEENLRNLAAGILANTKVPTDLYALKVHGDALRKEGTIT